MQNSEHVPSYYTATAHPAPDHPKLEGDLRTDVVVIGAGYTGISAALELAQRGYEVVVLEAHRVGWGASGRNGGQVIPGPCNPSEVPTIPGVAAGRVGLAG